MIKTLLVTSLFALAVASTAQAKSISVLSQNDLATVCTQSSGDQNATLKLGNGQSLESDSTPAGTAAEIGQGMCP